MLTRLVGSDEQPSQEPQSSVSSGSQQGTRHTSTTTHRRFATSEPTQRSESSESSRALPRITPRTHTASSPQTNNTLVAVDLSETQPRRRDQIQEGRAGAGAQGRAGDPSLGAGAGKGTSSGGAGGHGARQGKGKSTSTGELLSSGQRGPPDKGIESAPVKSSDSRVERGEIALAGGGGAGGKGKASEAKSGKGGEGKGGEGKAGEGKMATLSGGTQMARRAVMLELLITLVGVAASSAALYYVMKKLDPNAAAAKIAKQKKKEIARRLGRGMIDTNQYEDIIACDVINPEHIEVTFSSVGGLHDVKEALHELIILPLKRPELFSQGKLLRPQKGVLLYGPPGTGKTLLAKAVAKECGAVFINVRVASLMSKWFGEAQKLVTAVFTLAHKLQPAIIFIDEIDSFLGQRKQTEHEAITSMKTEFMSLWDGFGTDDNARVMVLCATNRPWDLDEAILRRLPRTFEIPLPDVSNRVNILKVILRDEVKEPGFDFEEVARRCEGYSGSDLMELCKQAAYRPLRQLLRDEQGMRQLSDDLDSRTTGQAQMRPLRTEDVIGVLETSLPAREAAEEYRRRRSGAGSVSGGRSGGGAGGSGDASSSSGREGVEGMMRLFALLLQASQAANGDANANGDTGNDDH